MDRPSDNSCSLSSNDPMMLLVDDFLKRAQQGERPVINEYCEKYPDLEEEIRDLFPALVVMEKLQPTSSGLNNPIEDTQGIPDQIGDYRILGELGRGGMGVVYEAEQESLGRHVALKVLSIHSNSANTNKVRFQQEARVVAKMHHTNIVPIFEVGEDSNYVFYAMQLILGQSLDLVIEELKHAETGTQMEKLSQSLSDPEAALPIPNDSGSASLRNSLSDSSTSRRRQFYRSVAKIALQASEALAYAHARGVIHRDIKPSNLLLDSEGVLWVTDFGLAKITDLDAQGLTQTGDFLGTLRYMSPERFLGKCDARADIYALGITLYELVLQRSAFDSSDRLKLIHLINHVGPAKPRLIDPSIPRDLETIILKSIEKEPKQRYRNAHALEQDLQRFINDEPIKAQRTSLWKQTTYWARRNRGMAAAIVSIASLLMVLLVGSTMVAMQQLELRKTAEGAKNVAEQARVEAEESHALAERNLYFSQMNFAGKIIGQTAGTQEIKVMTDTWLPSSPASDLRGWEWYYLRTYCLEEVLPLVATQPSVPLDAVWSPDQTRIATAQQDRNIYIWDSNSGKLLKTLQGHPNIVVTIAWNANGKLLAACDDVNNIWIWNLETGQTTHRFKAAPDALVEQVAWDRTGNQLAWSSNSSVFVWNRKQGNEKPIELRGGPDVITTLQWSPDGERIAGSGWRQRQSVIWDIAEQKISKDKFDASLVKWSREGHALEGWLLSTFTGEIKLFQVHIDTPIQRFLGHTAMARFINWGSDGKRFVSASADQTVRVWDITSGEQIRVFQGHTANVLTARFNRENTKIVSTSSDRSARVWDVKSPQKKTIQTSTAFETKDVLQDRPEISSLSWHPDGVQLAVIGLDRRLRVWDTTSSQLLSYDNNLAVESVNWSPNGQWLAMDELEGAGSEEYLGEEYISENPGVAIFRRHGSTAEANTFLIPHPQRCNGVAWAPQGERFATICNDKKVRVWIFTSNALNDGSPLIPIQLSEYAGHRSRPGDIQWNPKRKDVIATCDETGIIKIWDTAGERWTLTGHQGMIHQLSWSPDGEYLASAGQDGTIRIWSVELGHQINILSGHHNAVFSVAWSPFGNRIASGSRDSTVKIWEPLSGAEALSLTDHQGAVLSVAWSPDGTQLATTDITGAIILWDASQAYNEAEAVTH